MQGTLVDAGRRRFGADTRITGASRTDAGVHALGQVASDHGSAYHRGGASRRPQRRSAARHPRARHREAPAGFDARRAALGKRYAFLIDNGPIANPLLARYAWHIPQPLDVGAMRRALAALRGRHDFSAFCAAPGREKDPVCVIRAIRVMRRKERVAVVFSADRYLHHMARNIVGTAVAVGRGSHDAEWLAAVLESRDRTRGGADSACARADAGTRAVLLESSTSERISGAGQTSPPAGLIIPLVLVRVRSVRR